MPRGLCVIGTDTDVGKTVISAGIMRLMLSRGLSAAYFKPVATGMTRRRREEMSVDQAFVEAASGFRESPRLVAPFCYREAVAPHLAARRASRPIERGRIHQALQELQKRYDIILAEAAGGLFVPLSDSGDMQYHLLRELGFPCLLVSRPGLGTLNHTFLTLRVARQEGLRIKGIVINRFRGGLVEDDNLSTIRKLSGVERVFTLPAIAGLDDRRTAGRSIKEATGVFPPLEVMLELMEEL